MLLNSLAGKYFRDISSVDINRYMSTCDDTDTIKMRLDTELRKIKNEVDDLYETVYKGNGKPSLVTRVNSIEGKLSGLRDTMEQKVEHLSTEYGLRFEQLHQKIENKFGRLEGLMDSRFEGIDTLLNTLIDERKTKLAGSWQVKAAVITAITALIGAILTYFAK